MKLTFENLILYCIIHRDRIFIREVPLAASTFEDVLLLIDEHLEKQQWPLIVQSQLKNQKENPQSGKQKNGKSQKSRSRNV